MVVADVDEDDNDDMDIPLAAATSSSAVPNSSLHTQQVGASQSGTQYEGRALSLM